MIERLPSEIILTISSYLNFESKLILITTCRRLYNLISTTNLYSELNLLQYQENAEVIIETFKQAHYSGAQVKVLHVNMKKLSDELFFQLSTIFPNVARVISHESYEHTAKRKSRYSKGPMFDWSKTLEKYLLYHDWLYVLQVLNTTTFPRLKELVLGNGYEFEDRNEGFDTLYFLKYLKQAPSLNKLTMNLCSIDLNFLENLHSVCPYIKSLRFENVAFVINEGALTQSTMPAYSVSSFEIVRGYYCDENGILLDYITRKYQHLRHLQLHFNDTCSYYDFKRMYSGIGFTKYLNNAELEDEELVEYAKEYEQDYQKFCNTLKSNLEIYSVSGPKLIMNLPETVKSLKFSHYSIL